MYTIKLDKEYELVFDMRALRKAEKMTGQSIVKSIQDPTMDVVGGLVAVGLSKDISGLSIDKALDMIEKHSDYMTVVEIVFNALTDALGAKEVKQGKSAKNA